MQTPINASAVPHEPTQDHFQAQHGSPSFISLVPRWLLIAFGIVAVIGLILTFGRSSFQETAALNAMNDCEARLVEKSYGNKYEKVLNDGLHDGYGSVHIGAQRENIAKLVTICDTDPQTGLRLFRAGLDTGNKSARMIALYCANYLARAQIRPQADPVKGFLQAEDFNRILAHIDPVKEKDADVRKVALKALSDLVVLPQVAAKERYETLPPELPKSAETPANAVKEDEDPSKRIKTKEFTQNEKTVLLIRWSSPLLARAWWEANAKTGAWDMARQRFVIP